MLQVEKELSIYELLTTLYPEKFPDRENGVAWDDVMDLAEEFGGIDKLYDMLIRMLNTCEIEIVRSYLTEKPLSKTLGYHSANNDGGSYFERIVSIPIEEN